MQAPAAFSSVCDWSCCAFHKLSSQNQAKKACVQPTLSLLSICNLTALLLNRRSKKPKLNSTWRPKTFTGFLKLPFFSLSRCTASISQTNWEAEEQPTCASGFFFNCFHKTLKIVITHTLLDFRDLSQGRRPVKTKAQIHYRGWEIPYGNVCKQRNTETALHCLTSSELLQHRNLMGPLQYSWMPLKNSRHVRRNAGSQWECCLWFQ